MDARIENAEWFATEDETRGLADVLADVNGNTVAVQEGITIADARAMVAEHEAGRTAFVSCDPYCRNPACIREGICK